MKISRSAGYGLVAAGYIALHSEDGPVLSNAVSKEYDIPLEYLLKIMQQLVRANILRSKRGPRGGFTLARPANTITLLEIVEAVGGPISSPMEIVELTNKARFSVRMEKLCREASAKAGSILGKAKLSQMIKK